MNVAGFCKTVKSRRSLLTDVEMVLIDVRRCVASESVVAVEVVEAFEQFLQIFGPHEFGISDSVKEDNKLFLFAIN